MIDQILKGDFVPNTYNRILALSPAELAELERAIGRALATDPRADVRWLRYLFNTVQRQWETLERFGVAAALRNKS